MRFGKVGSADIIGLSPQGRFIAVECKDKSKATEKQIEFLEEVRKRGGIAILAHSIDDVIGAI